MSIKEEYPGLNLATRSMWDKGLNFLSKAVIVSFVVSLGLGLLVPLYTDEVATKFVQARFLAEGGKLLSLFPQCTLGFVLDIPASWYPAAFIYSFIYSGLTPIGIRLSGVALNAVWLSVSIWCFWLMIPVYQDRLRAIAASAAILSFGVFPLTMVLARSEQWLVLLLTCYLLLALLAEGLISWRSGWRSVGLLAAFLLLTSLLSYSHSKALFFIPFVMISALLVFKKQNKLLLGVAVVFAIFTAFQSYQFAKTVISCDDAPILSKILASQTTRLPLLAESPTAFLGEIVGNLTAAPRKIVKHLVFQANYQSGWLPAFPEFSSCSLLTLVNGSIRIVLYMTFWLAVLLPPLVFLVPGRQRPSAGTGLLFGSLWIGLVGHLALFREWNFYGAALILPLMCFLLAASFFQLFAYKTVCRVAGWLLAPLLVLSLSSFSILAFQVAPPLFGLVRSTSDTLQGQPLSINAFAFEGARARIRELSATCGLQGDGSSRLVVDDLTYFAFKDLHQPLHAVYLYEGGFGSDIGNRIRDFLGRMESDGVVSQCTYLSPLLLKDAVRDGNLCCINLRGGNNEHDGSQRPWNAGQK